LDGLDQPFRIVPEPIVVHGWDAGQRIACFRQPSKPVQVLGKSVDVLDRRPPPLAIEGIPAAAPLFRLALEHRRKPRPATSVVYPPDGVTGTVAPEGFAWLGLWIEWDDEESGPLAEQEWPNLRLLSDYADP
jgi:hypothetical protein